MDDNDGVEKKDQDLEKEAQLSMFISSMENENSKNALKVLELGAKNVGNKTEEVKIGKDSYSAQKISSESKRESFTENHIGYVVKENNIELLIEVMYGNDTSEEIKNKLDEILSTFTIISNAQSNIDVNGEFVVWADDHTVEIKVKGTPQAYQVQDENVKKILDNFKEVDGLTFKVEEKDGMKIISTILGDNILYRKSNLSNII